MLLLLLACNGKGDDSAVTTAEPCGGAGSIHTCVWFDAASSSPEVNAYVFINPVPNDDAIEGRTGEDGCWTANVDAGQYRVYATSVAGDCSSNTQTIDVAACDVIEITTYLADRCTDR